MAAMKPRTGDGPLEVTKEGRGIVMRVPLEGGGRLVVEMSAEEATALGDALKSRRLTPARPARPGAARPERPRLRAVRPPGPAGCCARSQPGGRVRGAVSAGSGSGGDGSGRGLGSRRDRVRAGTGAWGGTGVRAGAGPGAGTGSRRDRVRRGLDPGRSRGAGWLGDGRGAGRSAGPCPAVRAAAGGPGRAGPPPARTDALEAAALAVLTLLTDPRSGVTASGPPRSRPGRRPDPQGRAAGPGRRVAAGRGAATASP